MYVLPYGQMSLWGYICLASDANIIYSFIYQLEECLEILYFDYFLIFFNFIFNKFEIISFDFSYYSILATNINIFNKCDLNTKKYIKIRANRRIGPHNKDILSIIFGSLLGDGYAEKRNEGTRINFYQEDSHSSYLIWLHTLISNLGYCNSKIPIITTRLGSKGKLRKIIRFSTWTYSSLNWVHNLWYINGKKVIPKNIQEYLTPLSLAIWIMDDGGKVNQGIKLSTNYFSYSECLFLIKVLYEKFELKCSVESSGHNNQYIIYIWKESMNNLRNIVLPYVHSSMKYKLYK